MHLHSTARLTKREGEGGLKEAEKKWGRTRGSSPCPIAILQGEKPPGRMDRKKVVAVNLSRGRRYFWAKASGGNSMETLSCSPARTVPCLVVVSVLPSRIISPLRV